MKAVSITPATSSKAPLRGVALASVIIALIALLAALIPIRPVAKERLRRVPPPYRVELRV